MKHNYISSGKKIFALLVLASVFVFPHRASSQLVVTSGGTPQSIINALIGAGLTISNIQLNCDPGGYGSFNGSTSNIGMQNGILLTSGATVNAVGPNNSDSETSDWGLTQADPQLVAIEPLATNDLCVLEFDIVPHCSSLQVRFVFGSEEYPEFVQGGFNDAFGFFITGPDSNCVPGFFNNTNVAVLPNSTPVSIDNINAGFWAGCPLSQTGCTNCAYYVNNCQGPTVEYDGFTTPVTVSLTVCPCATYHWKFAIADAGDGAYDSGVLIDYLSCSAPFNYSISPTPASCSCDGTATVNVSSGTPPYTYLWSTTPPQTTQTATGLCPGTYTVSVTDAASCSIPVTQSVTITASASNFTTTFSQTNVSCNGGSNGSATANVTGGAPQYAYTWSTTPVQNTQTASNLNAGTYTVTVTDSLNCVGTASVTITEPTALAIAFSNFSHTTCGYANGSISPSYSGGTGLYSYAWSNAQSSASVSNLAAGIYTVTVTDANNCSASGSFTINSSAPPIVLTNGDQSICLGSSVQLAASGAATYTWSPAAGLSATSGSVVDANPILTTTYMIIGQDAVGCSDTAYVTVTVNPLPLVASPANPSYCIGGSILITMSGAQYYYWSPQTGISNPNGADSTSVTITLPSTTTYTVTGFSAEGCSATTSFTVTVNPNPVAVITPSGPTTFCQGGQVILTASGGTSFLWSDNSTSASLVSGASDTYTVTVTDVNTCTATASETVTVIPPPPAVISPAGAVTICTSNPVTLSANTGTGYTYQWYANSSPIAGETNSQYSTSTTGIYSVVVTDAIGCSSTSNEVQVAQGFGPAVTIASPPPFGCLLNAIYIGYGPQSIHLCAQSDASAVSYLWSTSETTQCIDVTQPGNYTVIAFDANGCPSPTPAVLSPAINLIDIRCGHGLKKIILCHVPEGQTGNPQTLCIAPPAVPPHLELHRYDCLGPCSLYYRADNMIEAENFYVYPYPNPFNSGFNLTILSASSNTITVNIHNMLGQIVETYTDVTEQTVIGAKLTAGIYFAEVIQDNNRQMVQIVKSE